MIKIEKLSKKFGRLQVLDKVSATFEAGRALCIIGPNGSGKTTLIKCLLGMVVPDIGSIFFNQQLITADETYRKFIGYMPQIGRYPENMTIIQLINMMKDIRCTEKNYDDTILKQYILPEMYNKKMQTLSGGTTQKVSAALAFLFNPLVLILDEPTSGLDPLSAEILKQKIQHEKTKGKLIVITSHIMSEIDEIADEIVYMQEGRIFFHTTPSQLKQETSQSKLGAAVAKLISQKQYV